MDSGQQRGLGSNSSFGGLQDFGSTPSGCSRGLCTIEDPDLNYNQYDYVDENGIQRNSWQEWISTWPTDLSKLAEELSTTPFKRILFHDIIPSCSRSMAQQLAQRISERRIDNGILIISFHPEKTTGRCPGDTIGHIHFVHDCTFNQSYCRCAAVATLSAFNLRFKRRSHGSTTMRPAEQCSKVYIYWLLSYLTNGKLTLAPYFIIY